MRWKKGGLILWLEVKRMNYRLVIGVFIAIVFSACFKDQEPGTPAYIRVESIQTQLDRGTTSSNITDAWVGVDGQTLGAGTFPAEFPVIINENFDTNSIRIQAGIKKNGIANTRAIYPFYQPAVIRRALKPGETEVINVVMGYDPATKIKIVEDFEDPNQPNFTDDLDNNPNTGMRFQTVDVFEGTASGQIYLDSANLECTVASTERYTDLLGPSATPIYLEMNFKTNTVVQVGIRAHSQFGSFQTIYKGGLNPSDTWRKIHFEFTEEIFGTNAASYTVIFRALRDANVEPEIYVDNIQILYF